MEKLLKENSKYENAYLTLKSSYFRLSELNNKYYSAVKYLSDQNADFKGLFRKTKRIYNFFKNLYTNSKDNQKLVLSGKTFTKIFEFMGNINIMKIDKETEERPLFKVNTENEYNFTV